MRPLLGRLYREARLQARYGGMRLRDPICGRRFRRFEDGARGRPQALCPACGSAERHRVLWLYLQRHRLLDAARILHVSPEPGIARRLRARAGSGYVSVDIEPDLAMVAADLTDLPFEAATFDLVLCAHVLEHVRDDVRAMTELWRVLAPGGTLVLQHPIDARRARTYEDWSLTSPEARERAFFQSDHVRIYGADFVDRLTAAGVERVERLDYRSSLPAGDVRRLRLEQHASTRPERDIEADVLYLARRP